MKKYIVELIGTFALSFIVLLSISHSFPVPTAVLAGLTLGLFVYSVGNISGAHINPAVTLGLLSIRKINIIDALWYIVAQCIGALIALFVVSTLFSLNHPVFISVNTMQIFFAELIGAFFFTFGIASAVYGATPRDASGIVVGGSLLLGISMAAMLGSNGILNPAVALGIGSFNLVYVLGTIVGSVLGMNAYKMVHSKSE